MGKNRSEVALGAPAASVILGLALSFVASGCGILKNGGDDIGEGYLSEGGWDPFSDTPPTRQRDRDRDPNVEFPDPDSDGTVAEIDLGSGSEKLIPGQTEASKGVEGLFKKGDYRKALAGAEALRVKSAPASADRDVADFIIGASQYYLGRFQSAQSILDSHVEEFEQSRHRESALYYQAGNRVRLRQWRVAAALLDNFTATYPESLLLEFALFDRAMCHFGLGENDDCLKLVTRMEREYIYSKIRDRVLALRGDVLQETGDLAGAQAGYQKAREAAAELKHPDLEARCLANLTAVAADRGQNATAVKYYDAFFKNYRSSQYATKAALGGLPALQATGRLDSGLDNLESILKEMPQATDASVFNDTLVEYAKFYREKNGPEKLLRQLGNLSSSAKGSERLKEQLVVARLEALETYFPERHDEIRVFYREMRSRFKPADLSAANVLKMADYISEKTPDAAIPWYENVLARGGSLHSARATFGLAKAHAMVGKDREAEAGFRRVLETFGSPELAEEATLGIARIARKKKDWSASAYYWTSYLDHKEWNAARDEARKGLAESKSNGGVAKAPASSHTLPVKAVSKDPIELGLARAEALAEAGKREAAFSALDRMLKRYDSTQGLPKSSTVSLRKAETMHEDLAVELGK